MATSQEEIPNVKVVVIGDAEIGKTCLLISYRSKSSQSLPSIFNGITVNKTITINNQQTMVNINLCDSSTEEQYNQFRIKSYKNCDICLVCFNIFSLTSLQNIGTIWIPEIQKYAPNSLIILIGLKCDLRGNEKYKETEITPEIIKEYQTKYNIIHYIETSALRKININQAFEIGIEKLLSNDNNDDNNFREYRALSATSIVDENEINENDPSQSSLNSIMKTHRRQWTEHLQSMGLDSNDSILRNRDDTNISFPNANISMGGSSITNPQQYRISTTSSITPQQQQQQMAIYQQQQQYYQQYYRHNQVQQQQQQQQQNTNYQQQGFQAYNNSNQGLLPNVMENQSSDNKLNVIPPPPPPPPMLNVIDSPSVGSGQKGNDFNEPLLLNGQKKTASHVGSVSIDYEMGQNNDEDDDDEQDKKRKKGSCCIIL